MFENRKYLVIPASIVDNINFSQVHETSASTLRYSVDGTQTFVKYDLVVVTEPIIQTVTIAETGEPQTTTIEPGVYGRPSIYSAEYPEYTHEEMLMLLSTEAWTSPITRY